MNGLDFKYLELLRNWNSGFFSDMTVCVGNQTVTINSATPDVHGISISCPGYSMCEVQPGKTLKFTLSRAMSHEVSDMLVRIYLTYITSIPGAQLADSQARIKKIENTIKTFTLYNEQAVSGSLEENAARYFEVAKSLRAVAQNIFLSIVAFYKECFITNNCYNDALDDSFRQVFKIFHDIFNHYVTKGELKEAFQTAKEMVHTAHGTKAFVILARKYLENKDLTNSKNCLNSISTSPFCTGIELKEEDAAMLMEGMDRKVLVELIFGLSSGQIKDRLIDLYSDRLFCEGKIQQVSELLPNVEGAANKGKLCGKIVDVILSTPSLSLMDRSIQAQKVIPLIGDNHHERTQNKKIIQMFFSIGDIPNTLKNIPLLKDSYHEREEYKKIIDLYIQKKEISKVYSIIEKLKDKYHEREQYEKVISFYVNEGEFLKAAETIRLFKNSYHEKEAFKQLFSTILTRYACLYSGEITKAEELLEQAKSIMEKTSDQDTKNYMKAKLFDCM